MPVHQLAAAILPTMSAQIKAGHRYKIEAHADRPMPGPTGDQTEQMQAAVDSYAPGAAHFQSVIISADGSSLVAIVDALKDLPGVFPDTIGGVPIHTTVQDLGPSPASASPGMSTAAKVALIGGGAAVVLGVGWWLMRGKR